MAHWKAPAVPLYKYYFQNYSQRWKLIGYRTAVLLLTFFAYMSYHLAKRPISVVKAKLNPNCTITHVNNTCGAWEPFNDPKRSKELFGLLDCAFLMSYALSMFVSGYLAEHSNLRIYLSIGMLLTGMFTALFGMAFYWKIHSLSYFFLVQIITGIVQSTGWPSVVEAVGVWFPEGRRGLVMGIWNTHVSFGNMAGSVIAGAFVDDHWGLSFIIPGCIIAAVGILIYIFLVPEPGDVDLEIRNNMKIDPPSYPVSPELIQNDMIQRKETDEPVQPKPIGIWGALKIPGVIEYSLCLFFAKLVSYTFLFWLPFYINTITIAGKRYSDSEAADWAILFDVGGALGGIIAGSVSDLSSCPAIVNVVMLLFAAPSLFLFKFYGTASIGLFIFYMMISGFFVNGPYALITTAVSASLGTHQCLFGNTKAMAVVTSIIDGTGSLGAAVGPLLAGVISDRGSWDDVFYMLIFANVCAALFLTRQFAAEVSKIRKKVKRKLSTCKQRNDSSESINAESDPLLSST